VPVRGIAAVSADRYDVIDLCPYVTCEEVRFCANSASVLTIVAVVGPSNNWVLLDVGAQRGQALRKRSSITASIFTAIISPDRRVTPVRPRTRPERFCGRYVRSSILSIPAGCGHGGQEIEHQTRCRSAGLSRCSPLCIGGGGEGGVVL
jgi:hypothetical protein